MFDDEFYPTPVHVLSEMLVGENIAGKIILEPSAGKGDIVDFLLNEGACTVLAVERHPELRSILEKKCTVIGHDFLQIKSEQISHVQMIVMNPPFTQQDQHILHAWEIAPAGCRIVSLCNYSTYSNDRRSMRRTLRQLVTDHGSIDTLGMCFTVAERTTDIEIGLIKLLKPGGGYEQEFQGFFMFEEEEAQASGVMPYNAIRDLVNRYVEAIKIFDRQLDTARDLHQIMVGYFDLEIAMTINREGHAERRLTFVKDLQKSGWKYIFNKLGLEKYSTKGLKEDINKFVESQLKVPFTMRNIYRMLEIVIATTTQRMDKALLEVFDRLTLHHHENRFNVE